MIGQLLQEVYEYLEEYDQMNWSARSNVFNQYMRNTSIGTTVNTICLETTNDTPALENNYIPGIFENM